MASSIENGGPRKGGKAATQEAILLAATQLFMERGYEGTTLRDHYGLPRPPNANLAAGRLPAPERQSTRHASRKFLSRRRVERTVDDDGRMKTHELRVTLDHLQKRFELLRPHRGRSGEIEMIGEAHVAVD